MCSVSLKEGKPTLLLPWFSMLSSTKANTNQGAELLSAKCQQMILICSWEAELTDRQNYSQSLVSIPNRGRADGCLHPGYLKSGVCRGEVLR